MKSEVKPEPVELRAHPRAELDGHAIISLPQGGALDCSIQNISEGGAVLLLTDPKVIPVRFWLSVPEHDIDRECMVCRFSGSRISVKFLSSSQ
ncbi:MAG: PilZ domain-containing protein [Hyphomicrobiaceae bacterium]